MNPRIAVINGPNLNLLGSREPEIYGRLTLADVETRLRERAATLGASVTFLQSNHEGELVDLVQRLREGADAAIVNLGAYTHTSLAIRDAFLAAPVPFVEVHLSNLFRAGGGAASSRSPPIWRSGLITGFGARRLSPRPAGAWSRSSPHG